MILLHSIMVYDAIATYASKQENAIDITETLN